MILTLANFKQAIEPAIQQRGQRYYANGRVIALIEIDSGHWRAVVEGPDTYQVEVSVSPDGVLNWTCDCPYEWGAVCKHVAAVLYALEDGPSSSESEPSTPGRRKSRADKVRDALGTLSGEQLYDLLLELVLEDRELTNLVLARYGLEEGGEKAYHQLVVDAISVGQGRYGFLDYRGASRAAKGINMLLGRANSHVAQGKPEQAISIYKAVVEEVVPAMAQAAGMPCQRWRAPLWQPAPTA